MLPVHGVLQGLICSIGINLATSPVGAKTGSMLEAMTAEPSALTPAALLYLAASASIS